VFSPCSGSSCALAPDDDRPPTRSVAANGTKGAWRWGRTQIVRPTFVGGTVAGRVVGEYEEAA